MLKIQNSNAKVFHTAYLAVTLYELMSYEYQLICLHALYLFIKELVDNKQTHKHKHTGNQTKTRQEK